MDNWLEIINNNNLYSKAHAATMDDVVKAEKRLELTFADDYREFLLIIGACICFGHEINGIMEDAYLNAVNATQIARNRIDLIPHSWYVIEDTHMDGILILQDKKGRIYQMSAQMMPMKIADSLENYLSDSIVWTGNNALSDLVKEERSAVPQIAFSEEADEILNQKYVEAKEKLENPDQVESTLLQVEKKLQKIPGVGDWLADAPAMISLVRSYIRKEYREVPFSSIIAAFAALLYVVSPADLIPDAIPGVGMLDDAAVFVACWKIIHDDVDKYKKWRKQTE